MIKSLVPRVARWLLDRLDEQDESRAVQVEQALMKLHKNWKPLPVYKQVDIVESLPGDKNEN